MIRFSAIAALAAAALATPALAGDNATAGTDAKTFTAQLTAVANEKQVRDLLASQGYIATSELNRDDAGRWVGTAIKDGKAVRIGVKMPPRNAPAPLTN